MDLEYPQHSDELYLDRGNGVNPFRPIMQGDVFPGVSIPGVEEEDENLAIIVTHPCSMRRGAELVEHLQMIRVRRRAKFPLKSWSKGYFGVMPLPSLRGESTEEFFTAVFDEIGRVPTAELDLEKRLASLSPRGLMLMQQRMVFRDTRVVVDTPTLMERSEPVLAEAELLEEWNEEIIGSPAVEDFHERMHLEARLFDDLLSAENPGEEGETFTWRDRLRSRDQRALVRKFVRQAMVERRAAVEPNGNHAARPS